MTTNQKESDFIEEWEEKKKESEALHRRAYNKMRDLWCVFTGKQRQT